MLPFFWPHVDFSDILSCFCIRVHCTTLLQNKRWMVALMTFSSTPSHFLQFHFSTQFANVGHSFLVLLQLDLSELPRDQVSGQTSAECYPSRPSNPNSGYLCSYFFNFLCVKHMEATLHASKIDTAFIIIGPFPLVTFLKYCQQPVRWKQRAVILH